MRHRLTLQRALLVLWVLALGAGCAGTATRDVARPRPADMALGTATPADIEARFGSPQQRARALKDGVEVLSLSYSHADPAAPSAAAGVPAARTMAFYFAGGRLVGYEALSTFKADSSDFDDTRVSDIRRGHTTEAQVRDMVGPPSGVYIYPLTRAPDERDLVYVYGQKKGRAPLARKQLLVTVDPRGIVREIQYEKSGEW